MKNRFGIDLRESSLAEMKAALKINGINATYHDVDFDGEPGRGIRLTSNGSVWPKMSYDFALSSRDRRLVMLNVMLGFIQQLDSQKSRERYLSRKLLSAKTAHP